MNDATGITAEVLEHTIDFMEEGERLIYFNLDEDLYHGAPGVGSSLLKAASKSMAHYKLKRDGEYEQTPAMLEGSMLHCLVLEPDAFWDRYAISPEGIDRRTGEGKKAWAAFLEESEGKEVLKAERYEEVKAWADAVNSNARQYLSGGHSEVSYFYKHQSGLILKARVDYQAGDAAIDLKTTKDDEPQWFTRTVKYDYALQDALYRLVTGLKDMIFIGVTKTAPYPVHMRIQGDDVRERAEKKMEELFDAIITAEELDDYPAFPLELIKTELTSFERQQEGM